MCYVMDRIHGNLKSRVTDTVNFIDVKYKKCQNLNMTKGDKSGRTSHETLIQV